MNENFLHISREKCILASIESKKNALRKINSAEKLAETEDYGTAISCLIIGLEELIKSLILYLDGNGFRLRSVKGMKAIFHNHEIRHFIAFIVLIFSAFVADMKLAADWINKITPKIKPLLNKIDPQSGIVKYISTYGFAHISVNYINKKVDQLRFDLEYFKNGEIIRQKGFYTDYDNGIKSPSSISNEEFHKFKIKVDIILAGYEDLIIEFDKTDKEALQEQKKWVKQFQEGGFYEGIEEGIKLMRSNKDELYEKTISSINEVKKVFELIIEVMDTMRKEAKA